MIVRSELIDSLRTYIVVTQWMVANHFYLTWKDKKQTFYQLHLPSYIVTVFSDISLILRSDSQIMLMCCLGLELLVTFIHPLEKLLCCVLWASHCFGSVLKQKSMLSAYTILLLAQTPDLDVLVLFFQPSWLRISQFLWR